MGMPVVAAAATARNSRHTESGLMELWLVTATACASHSPKHPARCSVSSRRRHERTSAPGTRSPPATTYARSGRVHEQHLAQALPRFLQPGFQLIFPELG